LVHYQKRTTSALIRSAISLFRKNCSFKRATLATTDKLRIPTKIMTDVAAVVAAAATSRGIGYDGQLVGIISHS